MSAKQMKIVFMYTTNNVSLYHIQFSLSYEKLNNLTFVLAIVGSAEY